MANNIIQEWIRIGDVSKGLYLSRLGLTELPNLPNNLQILNCDGNKLTSLPNLPHTLISLQCRFNKLESLPDLSLLINLKVIRCKKNRLTSLPTLPNSLQRLDCSFNQLTNLPDLPNNLKFLECMNNNITSLHIGNLVNLKILDFTDNNVEDIDILPISLKRLYCRNNQLQILPNLSNCIKLLEIDCYRNKLESLPDLSRLSRLYKLNCYGNKLTYLPDLPDLPNSLSTIYFGGNRDLVLTLQQITFIRSITSDINNLPEDEIDEDEDEIQQENNEPLPEETPEELQLRTDLANTRMNQINQQNLLATESLLNNNDMKSNQPDELKLETTYNIDNVNCNNTSHFDGDDLAFVNKIIVLLTPTKYILYCFQRDELFESLQHSSEPVFVWQDDKINRPDWVGQPDRKQRVYKEPYTGLWLTSDSLIYLEIYNVLVLTQLYSARLGTGNTTDWVSRMHGTDEDIHMLYTLYPVNYSLIANKSKITQADIKSFIPTREDIDILCTDLEITDNKITSESYYSVEITWNENVRTDKVGNKTLVFNRL